MIIKCGCGCGGKCDAELRTVERDGLLDCAIESEDPILNSVLLDQDGAKKLLEKLAEFLGPKFDYTTGLPFDCGPGTRARVFDGKVLVNSYTVTPKMARDFASYLWQAADYAERGAVRERIKEIVAKIVELQEERKRLEKEE